jgi:hypothetical protein
MDKKYEVDGDTGNEIITFTRRGRMYIYLRDMQTKRFIQRLKEIEIRLYETVDYSTERAKKQNPVYIDSAIFTVLNEEEYLKRDEALDPLERATEKHIETMFGKAVVNKLLELAGVEYGSKPAFKTKYSNKRATIMVVWKHKPEDQPRKKVEEVNL